MSSSPLPHASGSPPGPAEHPDDPDGDGDDDSSSEHNHGDTDGDPSDSSHEEQEPQDPLELYRQALFEDYDLDIVRMDQRRWVIEHFDAQRGLRVSQTLQAQ